MLAALAEQRQPAGRATMWRRTRSGRWPRSRSRAATAPASCRSIWRSRACISTRIAPPTPIPLLRRIVLEQPQYAEGSVLLADAQEAAGAPDAAVETLTSLLDDQPQFFRGRVQLAELYEQQRRVAAGGRRVGARCRRSSRATPKSRRAARPALLNAGSPAEAREVLKDALKIAPNDVRMSFMLAQAQRDAGDLAGAEATARALQAAHPEDVRATYLLAQMLEAAGRYQEIVDLLKPEIARPEGREGEERTDRDAARRPRALSSCTHVEGGIDEATGGASIQDSAPRTRKRSAAEGGKFPRTRRALPARRRARSRRPARGGGEGVPRRHRQAIRSTPTRSTISATCSPSAAGRSTKRSRCIQRALKIEPDNPSFLDSLGWAYFQQGKLDLADRR